MAAKTISFPKGRGHLTHNNREFISKNVVSERTSWNRIYQMESLEAAYENCFGEALRKYNAAQKRKDRQKENYQKEIEQSGNGEKLFYENIVQVGKKTDTPVVNEKGELTEDAKAAIKVLEQYATTFQERNPNLYLFNCVLHLDVKYSIVLMVYGVYRVREKRRIGTSYTNRKKNVYDVTWKRIRKILKSGIGSGSFFIP